MKARFAPAAIALSVAACSAPEAPEPPPGPADSKPGRGASRALPSPEPSGGWEAAPTGEGVGLVLAGEGGKRVLALLCPKGAGDLLVNVPAFRPVGSEERMSFGSGGMVVTLVADSRGDRVRGGVTGSGPRPAELAAILEGPLAVNYGFQNAGPYAAPPPRLAAGFLAGCGG